MLDDCNKAQDSTDSTKSDCTISTEVGDVEVTEKIKSTLLLDETIKGFDIKVVPTKGVVRLTGEVETQAQLN